MKMNKIDALLVLPPMYQSGRVPDYNPKEPMGLMYVGAALRREDCSVEILDADIHALTIKQTVSEILKRPAKVIGFSVMQRALPSIKLLVEQLRNEGVTSHISCGGFTATLSAKHMLEQMPAVDSIVLGEGEVIFSNLINMIKGSSDWKHLPGIAFRQKDGVVIKPPAIKTDVDSLAWPVRDLLSVCFEKTNYATILASRGCYGICTFCDLHMMGFCRSNDIDKEVALLMKQAGFERMLIGIESANSTVLRLFKKGESLQTIRQSIDILRRVQIDIVPGFMIFNPYTTTETLETDLDFLEAYGFTPTLSKALRIFDGTPLQEIMSSEGRLIRRSPFEGYHEYLVDPSIASIYMALKTVSVEWIDLLRKTYQEEIWGIKKAPAFNKRLNFDVVNKLVFRLEKGILKSLLSWTKSGFCYQDIVEQIAQLKDQIVRIEQRIVSTSGLARPTLNVQNFSVTDLAGGIHSILVNKIFRTFPEQYRWNAD